MHLSAILSLLKDPQSNLGYLLQVISERFPLYDDTHELIRAVLKDRYKVPGLQQFNLSSFEQQCQHTSYNGFLLLEKIEGAPGSTEQKVEEVKVED